MTKKIKYVVAIILKKNIDGDEFLVVKRPDDDPDLGGHWGFPATTMKPGELPEQTAKRICKEKLACDGEVTRFLGIMFQKRNAYDIFLMDVEMVIAGDQEPSVRGRLRNTRCIQIKNGQLTRWISRHQPTVVRAAAVYS